MNRITDALLKALGWLKERWAKFSKTARVVTLSVTGAVVLSLIVLIVIFNQSEYEVLYTGMSSTETAEVITALQEMAVTDVRSSPNEISVPKSVVNSVRMNLSLQGFPRSTYNFDHYLSNVSMFSTDSEQSEIGRQQLSYNLKATLLTLDPIADATVMIVPETDQKYVLDSNKSSASVSVSLRLGEGKTLNSEQIDGIYNLVLTSIKGLERKMITIVDSTGAILIPEDAPSGSQELILQKERWKAQQELQESMAETLSEGLDRVLTGVKRYTANVSVLLDYGNETIDETTYSPSNPGVNDPTRGGMVGDETRRAAYGGVSSEAGVIGTAVDADISPDYPTIPYDAGADVYYDMENTVQYKVNELVRHYENDGMSISKLTASVTIDDTPYTDEELDAWRWVIANAIGADFANVTVLATPWPVQNIAKTPDAGLLPETAQRNTLIFIIIALGALLVILFFLAIMTSGSKKRRHVKARLAAQAAGGGSVSGHTYEAELFGDQAATKVVGVETAAEQFNVESLLGDGSETRESVLKSEIREFARTNPDIVAQLIRTWMKE